MIPKHLNIKLLAMLGSVYLVEKWWNTPNKALYGDTPRDAYQKDKANVESYINYIMAF